MGKSVVFAHSCVFITTCIACDVISWPKEQHVTYIYTCSPPTHNRKVILVVFVNGILLSNVPSILASIPRLYLCLAKC